MVNRILAATGLAIALGLSACGPTPSQPDASQSEKLSHSVSAKDIIASPSGEWLSHGRTYSEERFSPLTSIKADNVNTLGLEWSFDLGTSKGIEATPIVRDGIIYVTGTWNIVHALDAKTGEILWEFDPEVDRSRSAYLCCGVVNRGVAIWGDNIYTATIDGRLIALNAKTGKKVWDINTIDKARPYTITGAPRIINGKVIIGNGGAELGVRGYVSAYDAETGDMDWRFYTVPGNPEDGFENDTMKMAAETWNGEWWEAGGGGTVWDSMAYDPDLNLLYIGVGNGSPWNHEIRSDGEGDNLFLSSIVALNPDTGDYVWHYQTTPAETWDYTATQHMILADLEIEGKTRQVIMQAPKNGFFYVIDRKTGQLISANNYVPINWATHVDLETGRPVEIADARWPGKAPYLQTPGPLGGHNWHPMSFNPETGLVYIPAQELPSAYLDYADYSYQNGLWNTGADFVGGTLPTNAEILKAARPALKGRLLAWDPVKQEARWTQEHNGPWNGGTLTTAGNLVFQGTADLKFSAFNAKSGERLWSFFTQTGIVAAPVSYEIDGEQYVAVATGWGGAYVNALSGIVPVSGDNEVGRVLVFKLGADGKLPELETAEITRPEPPAKFGTSEMLVRGNSLYSNNCIVCHGNSAMSSAYVPNLRYSYTLSDAEVWSDIIVEGALAENGMPNFKGRISNEDAEAIRAFVVDQAHNPLDKAFFKDLVAKDSQE